MERLHFGRDRRGRSPGPRRRARRRRPHPDRLARRDLHRSAVRHRHRAQRGRGGRAYVDRADDPDAFVAWLSPFLAESHARARADRLAVRPPRLPRRPLRQGRARSRCSGATRFVNEIVWCYAVGGKSRRGFGRKHDTILWYARGDDWAFYPDAVRVAAPRRLAHARSSAASRRRPTARPAASIATRSHAGKVPEDWWTDIETLNHSRSRAHRLAVAEAGAAGRARSCAAVTRPGDRVADWFAGSGTTAAVAQRLGRRFVAVDREAAAIDDRAPRAWPRKAARPRRRRRCPPSALGSRRTALRACGAGDDPGETRLG